MKEETVTFEVPINTITVVLFLTALDDESATYDHTGGNTEFRISRDLWEQSDRPMSLEVPITVSVRRLAVGSTPEGQKDA